MDLLYLKELQLPQAEEGAFPFNSPALCTLGKRKFTSSVTFLVGENGTGKSTFLEALAKKIGMPALGRRDTTDDESLRSLQPLCSAMKLAWGLRPKNNFFLRAEDFFGFTTRIKGLQAEMREELRRVNEEYAGHSAFTRGQAAMAYAGSLNELNSKYGEDPDAKSHGESFLSVFKARMHPGGLYLLDEPEAALSPTRQLSLLAMLHQLQDSCQFIIATHSPMLTALPNADIWNFDETPITSVEWRDLPHVYTVRDFLNAPERWLRHIIEEET